MQRKYWRRLVSLLVAVGLLLGISTHIEARAAMYAVHPIATTTALYKMDGIDVDVYATSMDPFVRYENYQVNSSYATLGITQGQYDHLMYGMVLAQRAVYAGPGVRDDDVMLPDATRARELGPMFLQQLFWQGLHAFNPQRYPEPDVETPFSSEEIAFFFEEGTLSDKKNEYVRLNQSAATTSVSGIIGPLKLEWTNPNADIAALNRTGSDRSREPAFEIASGGDCTMISNNAEPYRVLDEVRVGQSFYLLYTHPSNSTVVWKPRVPIIYLYNGIIFTSPTGNAYVNIEGRQSTSYPELFVTTNGSLRGIADVAQVGVGEYKKVQDLYEGQAYDFRMTMTASSSNAYDIVIAPQQSHATGSTPEDAIPIYTPWQFKDLLSKAENQSKHFKLMNDMNISMNIPAFSGSLDGQGHAIYGQGQGYNQTAYLFTELSGTVKNLHFVDAKIDTKPTVTRAKQGTIAQTIRNGTVENCSVQGTYTSCYFAPIAAQAYNATIRNCRVYGSTITGNYSDANFMGGLIGEATDSLIEGCTLEDNTITAVGYEFGCIVGVATNTTIKDCVIKNTEIAMSQHNVGGIVGTATGSSNASPSSITNCRVESTVKVRGMCSFYGGIVAETSGFVVIESCAAYSDTTITSTASSYAMRAGGIAGGTHANSRVTRCLFAGSMNVGEQINYIGGIVAYSQAPIDNCENRGRLVLGANSYGAGGFAGHSRGDIRNSMFSGSIEGESYAGGFVYDRYSGTLENLVSTGSIRLTSPSQKSYNFVVKYGISGLAYYPTDQVIRINNAVDPTSFQGTAVPAADLQGESALLAAAGFTFGTAWQANPGAYPTVLLDPDPEGSTAAPLPGPPPTRLTGTNHIVHVNASFDGDALAYSALSYSANGGPRTPVPAEGIGIHAAANGGTVTIYYTTPPLSASRPYEGMFRFNTTSVPAFLRTPTPQTQRDMRIRVVRTGEDLLLPLEGSTFTLDQFGALPIVGSSLATQTLTPNTANDTVPYLPGKYGRLNESTVPNGYESPKIWLYSRDANTLQLCDSSGTMLSNAPLGFRKTASEIIYTYYYRGKLLPEKRENRTLVLKTWGYDGALIVGAKFDLYRLASSSDTVGKKVREFDMSTLDATTPVRLLNGRYKLVQTQAPTGCDASNEPLLLEFNVDEMKMLADASHPMKPRREGGGDAYTIIIKHEREGTMPTPTPTPTPTATPTPTPTPTPTGATPTPTPTGATPTPTPAGATPTPTPTGATPTPTPTDATPTPTPTPTGATPTPTPTGVTPTPTPTDATPTPTPTSAPPTPTLPIAPLPPAQPLRPIDGGEGYGISYALHAAKINDGAISASPVHVKPGDIVTFNAVLRNQGQHAAKPKYIAFAATPGLICAEANATLSSGQWFFTYVGDPVQPGAQVERSVRFRVGADARDDQTLWMEIAKLIDANGDERPNAFARNRAEVRLMLRAPYDMSLTKSVYAVNGDTEAARPVDGMVRVGVGDEVTFALCIANDGSMAARPQYLFDDPPSGMSFDAARNPGWRMDDGRIVYAYEKPFVQPGSSSTVYLHLKITRAESRMTNAASIVGLTGESDATVYGNASAGVGEVVIRTDGARRADPNGYGEMANTGETLPLLPGVGTLLAAGSGFVLARMLLTGMRRRRRAREDDEDS